SVASARALLTDKKIISVEVAPITGDLKMQFEGATILELFNGSSAYEAWIASVEYQPTAFVVAQGGGNVAVFDR
ncbi:MAG TPA: hypothetical protein VK690_07005, partial [Stellaceae bacterium]|nr:hypothetical protein [Stellaceae bacterium]